MTHIPPKQTNQAGLLVKVSSHPEEMCSPPPTLLLHWTTAEFSSSIKKPRIIKTQINAVLHNHISTWVKLQPPAKHSCMNLPNSCPALMLQTIISYMFHQEENDFTVTTPPPSIFLSLFAPTENPRVQENAAGSDLPHLLHHTAQFRGLDGHHAHLLLRVRGAAVGHRPAGYALCRVRGQSAREMPRAAERWLPAEWVQYWLTSTQKTFCIFIFIVASCERVKSLIMPQQLYRL